MHGEVLRHVLIVRPPHPSRAAVAQAVELYEDGVIVRWMIPGPVPDWAFGDEDPSERLPGFSLTDDVGTSYRPAGGSSGGGDGGYRGEDRFVPAVPESAAQLQLHGADSVAVLELPTAGARA